MRAILKKYEAIKKRRHDDELIDFRDSMNAVDDVANYLTEIAEVKETRNMMLAEDRRCLQ